MTREEQIKQAAEKSSEHISDLVWNFAYRAHFIAGAEWADAHPNWISVEDELPKDGQYTATINKAGVQDVRHYSHGKWYSNFGNEYNDITHWMPLPPPAVSKMETSESLEPTDWTEYTLQRDKDGFLVGEVSDLDVYLPFEVHDNKYDTWELIEDDSALVDWSGDIDTKPRYDRIRTMEPVVSKQENTTEQ